MGYSVRIITEYQDFLALQFKWTDLLKTSHHNRIFLTHQWFQCWWETFGRGLNLFILAVYDNDKLLGIAPLCVHKCRYRGMPVRQFQFMANGFSEETGFILARGKEEIILDLMLQYLISEKQRWDIIELKYIRDEPPFLQQLINTLNRSKLKNIIYPSKQVPYIPISGNWEELYSKRSKRFKKVFRARKNKIARHEELIQVEHITDPDKVIEVLHSIYDISKNSWKVENKKSLNNDAAAWTFFQSLATRLSPLGWIELWLVYAADKPIAFEYHFLYEGITSPIRADFDESYRKLSPGAYLEASIIQKLFETEPHSITEYNTCADGYAYTLRWTDLIHGHSSIRIFAPSFYGKVLYWLSRVKKSIKQKRKRRLTSVRKR